MFSDLLSQLVTSILGAIAGSLIQVLLTSQKKNELSYYVMYKGNPKRNMRRLKRLPPLPQKAYDSHYIFVLKLRNSGTDHVDTGNFAKNQIKFKFNTNVEEIMVIDSYP